MVIRKGKTEDYPEIDRLYEELFTTQAAHQPDTIRPAKQSKDFIIKSILDPLSALFVADTLEEGLCGFLLAKESRTPPYEAFVPQVYVYLMDVVVDEKWRGQGVGHKLLAACKDWAVGRRVAYIELNVLTENQRAYKLYKEQGYREVMTTMRYDLELD